MSKSIEEMQAENMAVFMEDGPRLSRRYNHWTEAKCTEHEAVLIGGLGGLGVGQLWFGRETYESHKQGGGTFAEAPESCVHGTLPDRIWDGRGLDA